MQIEEIFFFQDTTLKNADLLFPGKNKVFSIPHDLGLFLDSKHFVNVGDCK